MCEVKCFACTINKGPHYKVPVSLSHFFWRALAVLCVLSVESFLLFVQRITLPPTAAQVIALSIEVHYCKFRCVPKELFQYKKKIFHFVSMSVT